MVRRSLSFTLFIVQRDISPEKGICPSAMFALVILTFSGYVSIGIGVIKSNKDFLLSKHLSPILFLISFCDSFSSCCLRNFIGSSVVVGKPMQVPVFPPKRNVNQQKRQVDFDAGSRPAAASARQQTAGVPLQQAFRPAPPAEFRRPQQQRPQQERAQQDRPIQERPQREQEVDAATRGGAPSSFASAAAPEQTFTPARDIADRPAEAPVERPARQQPAQRPARPASFGAERPQRNPEFAAGFPSGFTSGLPSFDFQGRMPGNELFAAI